MDNKIVNKLFNGTHVADCPIVGIHEYVKGKYKSLKNINELPSGPMLNFNKTVKVNVESFL